MGATRTLRFLTALLVVWAVAPPVRADVPPNVLIVMTDDQPTGTEEATPGLVEWFSQGTRFSSAYATTPVCCPSRASIFSGRYAHNHGVTNNDQGRRLDHDLTLQSELKSAGYLTAYAGKFLNAWPKERPPPHFDKWTLGKSYRGMYVSDGERVKVDYAPTFVFDKGVEYVTGFEASDDTPWFMVLGVRAPHGPAIPEARYEDETFTFTEPPTDDLSDNPKWVRKAQKPIAKAQQRRAAQLRTLRSVDDAFLRTVAALDALGELDNTLVIYLSDNGYLLGQHGLLAKSAPYLPSVRIPMYARGPGVPVEDTDRLVATVDLAPTIYQATGVNPSYALDGRSLFSAPRERLLLEAFGDQARGVPAWSSLVTQDSHYISYGKTEEFYDLNADPHELTNLPAPDSVKTALAEAQACNGDCP